MSKLGVTPQDYTIKVPGFEGDIRLRRLSLGQIKQLRDEKDEERKGLMVVAMSALNRSGDFAYSLDNLDEVLELPLSLIRAIAESVIDEAKGKIEAKN
jgi:hypothetical protein